MQFQNLLVSKSTIDQESCGTIFLCLLIERTHFFYRHKKFYLLYLFKIIILSFSNYFFF